MKKLEEQLKHEKEQITKYTKELKERGYGKPDENHDSILRQIKDRVAYKQEDIFEQKDLIKKYEKQLRSAVT